MSLTERELNPTVSLWHENLEEVVQQPEQPQSISLSSHFSSSVNLDPQEPQVTLQSLLDNPNDQIQIDQEERMRREVVANDVIGVSANLNNPAEGMTITPAPKGPEQSDLCFGISSVLGITKEALGIEDDRDQEVSGLDLQQRSFNPVLSPFLRPSPNGSMG